MCDGVQLNVRWCNSTCDPLETKSHSALENRYQVAHPKQTTAHLVGNRNGADGNRITRPPPPLSSISMAVTQGDQHGSHPNRITHTCAQTDAPQTPPHRRTPKRTPAPSARRSAPRTQPCRLPCAPSRSCAAGSAASVVRAAGAHRGRAHSLPCVASHAHGGVASHGGWHA